MARHLKALAAAAAALSLMVAGCSGGDAGGGAAAETTLTLGSITQATTFAAKDMRWANESFYGQAVYDTLLIADPEGKVQPHVATEWTYDTAKTKLTLKIRTDIKFSDGEKLTADVVAQNLKRFRDGVSPNKNLLEELADAKAVDESTVELTLKQPDPGVIVGLSRNAGLIASPKSFGAADEKTKPVGSGPYVLDTEKTVPGTEYYFKKNPTYWKPEMRKYDNLVVKVFTDPTALLNAAKSGQVNGSNVIDRGTLKEYEASGYTLNKFELDWLGVILYDRGGSMTPAMKDVRVRRAINMAFDRASILTTYGQGFGTVTEQIFPPRSAAFDKSLDSTYKYDPAAAKALLAQAGFPNGFTLKMPTSPLMGTTLPPIIQQQLKDIGVTVEFTQSTDYIGDMLAPKYSAAWMQLQTDEDFALYKFQIGPVATWNPFKYADPKVTALGATMRAGSDADAAAAAKDLNAYIVDQAWFVPWYRTQGVFVTDAKTQVKTQAGNAIPYLWNITPKA